MQTAKSESFENVQRLLRQVLLYANKVSKADIKRTRKVRRTGSPNRVRGKRELTMAAKKKVDDLRKDLSFKEVVRVADENHADSMQLTVTDVNAVDDMSGYAKGQWRLLFGTQLALDLLGSPAKPNSSIT